MTGRRFSIEAAEERLGPAAAAEARRSAASAPRFSPEQVECLRALVASAVTPARQDTPPAAKAA